MFIILGEFVMLAEPELVNVPPLSTVNVPLMVWVVDPVSVNEFGLLTVRVDDVPTVKTFVTVIAPPVVFVPPVAVDKL